MNERIKKLTDLTMCGDMYVKAVETKFDRMDLLLPKQEREVKRICEYILNQEPKLTEHSALTGFFRFDGSVIGDVFTRTGHPNTKAFMHEFYCKHIDNLSAMDWQHGTSDYRKVLRIGICGIIGEIEASIATHTDPEKRSFLTGLKKIAEAFVLWIKKCALTVAARIKDVEAEESKSSIYPSITSDFIKIDSEEAISDVQVVALSGAIYSPKYTEEGVVDVNFLEEGMYLLVVRYQTYEQAYKFIKE